VYATGRTGMTAAAFGGAIGGCGLPVGGASNGEGRLDREAQGGPSFPMTAAAAYRLDMSLPPGQPPLPQPAMARGGG
jgi:hypothetical protein